MQISLITQTETTQLTAAMRFAIDVLIFILGFSIAVIVESKPNHARSVLEDLLGKIRYITSAFRTRNSCRDIIDESPERQVRFDETEMLTK